jgi:hypothetical protein
MSWMTSFAANGGARRRKNEFYEIARVSAGGERLSQGVRPEKLGFRLHHGTLLRHRLPKKPKIL